MSSRTSGTYFFHVLAGVCVVLPYPGAADYSEIDTLGLQVGKELKGLIQKGKSTWLWYACFDKRVAAYRAGVASAARFSIDWGVAGEREFPGNAELLPRRDYLKL
jgi:hypothetical protein